jgi:probable HAF family extracellular repeat protein
MFSVNSLGSLGGSAAQAFGLNAAGDAAGSATNAFGYNHAFSNFGSGIRDLTLNNGASEGSAQAINSSGQIAGTQYINGQAVATVWTNGSAQSIAGPGSYGTGINDSGIVTGLLGNGHMFMESGGVVTDLGTAAGGGWSSGYGINTSGEIAGYGQISPGIFRAFVWTPTTGYVVLDTLGGTNSYAMAINDAGQAAGNSQTGSGVSHAVLWSNGTVQDLGSLGTSSYAYGINDSGEVVGYSYVNGEMHAFLYKNGVMLDLNSLIDPSSGWVLNAAYAINASGQIAGTGIFNGVAQAFLLDPLAADSRPQFSFFAPLNNVATPEPGTWVLAAIGLGLIVSSKIRIQPRPARRRQDRTPEPPR